MSHYVNTCVIGGNLVKKPDLRETQRGEYVANFIVALNRPYRESPDYIECVAWRDVAKSLCAHSCKGQQITVTGELETQNWKDIKGTIHKSTRVVVDKYSLGAMPKIGEARIRKPVPSLPKETPGGRVEG